jgi:glycerate-2-kinase
MGRPTNAPLSPRDHLRAIAASAIAAVRPGPLVTTFLSAHPHLVPATGRWVLVAAGKAARGMTDAVLRAAACPPAAGVVAAPGLDGVSWVGLQSVSAGHPLPDARSVEAGETALRLVAGLGPPDRLVVLLSGGASALLCAPVAGVTLEDKVRATDLLLRRGAGIADLNAVRKHLSRVKGGRLAAATAASVVTLAISDVVAPREDDPAVIGSGPTVGDDSTHADAWAALERADVLQAMPEGVRRHLRAGVAGRVEETPGPGDARLARSDWHLVGSRRDAMRAAAGEAGRLGYESNVIAEPLTGEAREAAAVLLDAALARASRLPRPCAITASGETTVRVRGRGRGGRNQELTLALAIVLAERGVAATVMSVGTDGVDGPTPAAGAMADERTVQRAAAGAAGDARARLDGNDSFGFFEALGDLVVTGPTGTNVADLHVLLFAD